VAKETNLAVTGEGGVRFKTFTLCVCMCACMHACVRVYVCVRVYACVCACIGYHDISEM